MNYLALQRFKAISTFILLLLSATSFSQNRTSQGVSNSPFLIIPSPTREIRAVWMTTVFNIDWPASSGNTTTIQTSQRALMNSTLDQMQAMNMNAVLLQVRSQCDAMYPSSIEPWSNYLTGRMGRPPAGTYDPLQEWITACKSRGMLCMAWFNPYRALTRAPAFNPPTAGNWDDVGGSVSNSTYLPPNHVYRAAFNLVRQVDATTWWMDPGEPAAAARAKAAIMDVVTRYDIDGVVFDDYFYPSGVTTAFDSSTFATYGGALSRSNWRRKNTDDFVLDISQSIKAIKPNLMFGIGPNGIYISGQPAGTNGQSAYNDLYADTKKWLQQGWVDFLSPQLYWQIAPPAQSYSALSTWWSQQNTLGRHLWISNAAYRLASTQGDWPIQELVDQVGISRNLAGTTDGNIYYNASAIQDDLKLIRSTFTAGIYSKPALIPATPWFPDQIPPLKPTLNLTSTAADIIFSVNVLGEQPRWIHVQALIGTTWITKIFNGTITSFTWPRKNGGFALRAIAVASVDRTGNISQYESRVFDLSSLFGGGVRD